MSELTREEKIEKWQNYLDELSDSMAIDPFIYVFLKDDELSKSYNDRQERIMLGVLEFCLEKARDKHERAEYLWAEFDEKYRK